ncbi:TPA: cob(I)yrinic acid a,c-diamide adenosyltransferase [Candidatus Poribacteria bacterium]|nr:cob(I)yrinic acid a,c-diamide adenosyltransferase [Candidatus Poribacteria bacterium]
MKGQGLVLINTGDGKGKSTAAFGAALRAAGHGMKVLIVQFIKSPKWRSGELKAIQKLENVEVRTMGTGFTWNNEDIESAKRAAKEAWRFASEKLVEGEYDLVVLDEINYAVRYGLLDVDEVIEGITGRAEGVHVILTGRGAHPKLIDLADTVTEMVEIKHHFRMGMKSVRGIEF